MKSIALSLAIALGLAGSASAELLINADFENTADTTGDGSGWEFYGNSEINNFFGNAHGSIFTDAGQFSGMFQDVAAVVGNEYTFTIEDARIEANAFPEILFGLEFRDASGNLLGTATQNVIPTGAELNGYTDSVTATAMDPNTASVRAIIKLDRVLTAPGSTSSSGFFVFDTTLTTVPEPGSLLLMGGGVLMMLRRKHAA